MADYPELDEAFDAEVVLAQWCLADFAIRAANNLGLRSECSISLRRGGAARRVASSDPRAARCDDIENQERSGACIEAMDELQVRLVPDLASEQRWPPWVRAAVDAGFRSAAAFPAYAGDGAEVAFNVYSEQEDPWTRDLIVRADMYAQQIGLVMGLVLNIDRLEVKVAAFESALAAQASIDQAVGALMVAEGRSAEDALALLTAGAVEQRVELSDAAAAVLAALVPLPAVEPES